MLRGLYAQAEDYFRQASQLATTKLAEAEIYGKLGEIAFKRGDAKNATLMFEDALRSIGYKDPAIPSGYHLFLLVCGIQQLLHSFLPRIFLHRKKREPTDVETLAMQLFSKLAFGCWFCRSKVECLLAHLRGMNMAEQLPPTRELAHAYSEHAPAMCLVPLFGRAIKYSEKSLALRRKLSDVGAKAKR